MAAILDIYITHGPNAHADAT